MKAFNCILGVFAILGSIYCLCYPGLTFLNSGWIVATLIGVYGICSIFEFFSTKKEKRKEMMAGGVIGLILGIGAAVVSVLAMFSIRTRWWIDLPIYMFSFWLVYSGIASIITSFGAKKAGGKMWVLSLILGILTILTGFYGALHPILTALSIGMFMGIGLMVYGIRLIASVFEKTE